VDWWLWRCACVALCVAGDVCVVLGAVGASPARHRYGRRIYVQKCGRWGMGGARSFAWLFG